MKGHTPLFSQVLKTATVVGGAAVNALPFVSAGEKSQAMLDQDAAVQEMARQHKRRRRTKENNNNNHPDDEAPLERPHFAYIVTRPTALLKEGPSTRTVAASKSVRTFVVSRDAGFCYLDPILANTFFRFGGFAATRSLSHFARGSGRILLECLADRKVVQLVSLCGLKKTILLVLVHVVFVQEKRK